MDSELGRIDSRAHPHSRGENNAAAWDITADGGSSPLTRGKRTSALSGDWQGGLIPTHAGKTRRATKRAVRSRAHPHSRGENVLNKTGRPEPVGSSPLTRGKRCPNPLGIDNLGLIPTHAGKTVDSWSIAGTRWAHPHSRGENVSVPLIQVATLGSSPLTRGKLDKVRGHQGHGGLIPTHAGKTAIRRRIKSLRRAHPHSRGENSTPLAASCAVMGSSPLTRGKRLRKESPRER